MRNVSSRLNSISFGIGAILAFLFCSYEGFAYAQRNPFHNFLRFYQALGPPSGFYASVNELIALAKSRASQSDVLVIVGGNSTFLGVAQPTEQIWTRKLTGLLGPGYVVLDLAQRGGRFTGAAGTVSEALIKQGYRVIYVANALPMETQPADGGNLYGYMYWNARARGLLYESEKRDRYLAQDQINAQLHQTLKIRGAFDRFANSEDLWNGLCYEKFCTAWDSFTYWNFWKPRKEFQDVEGAPPPAPQRFQPNLARSLEIVRELIKPGGKMDREDLWRDMNEGLDAGTVPELRSRSLLVLSSHGVYHVHQLTEWEQQRYAEMMDRTLAGFRSMGFHSIDAGRRFEEFEYADLWHLLPPGGERLAGVLAPEIQRIAREVYGK